MSEENKLTDGHFGISARKRQALCLTDPPNTPDLRRYLEQWRFYGSHGTMPPRI